MNRLACCIIATLAFVLSFDATARIRPSFNTQYAAWSADQVVVVRVGSTFEVLETWHGDLKPGDQLEMPSVGILAQAAYDELVARKETRPMEWPPGGAIYTGPEHGHSGKPVAGVRLSLLAEARAILFLWNEGIPTGYFWNPGSSLDKSSIPLATLLSARKRSFSFYRPLAEVIPLSITWILDERVHALSQRMNPGPPIPWRVRHIGGKQEEAGFTETQFRDEVLHVVAIRKVLKAVSAEEDPDARIQAIRSFDFESVGPARDAVKRAVESHVTLLLQRAEAMTDQKAAEATLLEFVKSDLFMPIWGPVRSLAKGDARAVPALIYILERPDWQRVHVSAIRALAAVNGPELGGEFVKRLDRETVYWRAKARELSPGWMQTLSSDNEKQYRELQGRSNHAAALLKALEQAPHPRRVSAVRAFERVWETVPPPFTRSSNDYVAKACRELLDTLATEDTPN